MKDRLPRPSQALQHSVEVEQHISLSFDNEELIFYNFSIDSPVSIICTKHVLYTERIKTRYNDAPANVPLSPFRFLAFDTLSSAAREAMFFILA